MPAFSALDEAPGKGRTGWKETVKLRLILILLKRSLQVLIPKDCTESQDLVILLKMSKWHLTEVRSFLRAGCIKYTGFFCAVPVSSHALLHQCAGGVRRLCRQKGSLPIRKSLISFTLAFITKISFSPSISICASVMMCVGKDEAFWTTALVCGKNYAQGDGGGIEGKRWSALRGLCNLNPSFWMKAPK